MFFWQIVATTALILVLLYGFILFVVRIEDFSTSRLEKKHFILAAKVLGVLIGILAGLFGVIALFGLIWGGFS